jgi:hypothetical protein
LTLITASITEWDTAQFPGFPAVCARVRPGLLGSGFDVTVPPSIARPYFFALGFDLTVPPSIARPNFFALGFDLTVLSSAEYPETLNVTRPAAIKAKINLRMIVSC